MASRAKRDPSPAGATARVRIPMSEQQLDAFYRDVFLPLVRRATWKHHLSKEDASDVVQDAFVLALEKIDCAGNPKAWLVQVVDHLALNLNRKAIRRTKLTSRWTSSNSNTPFSLDANGEAIVE